MRKIKKALISVSNKKKLKSLLNILSKFKIKLISSGGTYKEIKKLTKDQLIAYKGKEFKRLKQRRQKTLSKRELINLKNISTDRRKGERRYK